MTDAQSPRTSMIEAHGLTKHYGSFVAIQDVTFSIQPGEVVAFLGPNGAGKSTTMKILTGYLAPTSGTARVAGYDVASHRLEASQKLGYLPENGPLYPEMTPRGMLSFLGEARGIPRTTLAARMDEVIKTCSLETVLEKPIRKLSKGYRQRVGLAHVLLHDPEVIIMDEPTSGLDPNQIQHVRDLIRRLGETRTVLLSTHILQEVEATANRAIMIANGRLVFDGTADQLREEGEGGLDEAFHRLTGASQ